MTILGDAIDVDAILSSLGINWRGDRRHIRCPFPEHEDRHPSWRWDREENRWHCTCGSGDIYDVLSKMRGVNFVEAKGIAEIISGGSDERLANQKRAGNTPSRRNFRHPKLGLPSSYWIYRDAAGDTAEVRARYETADGKEVLPWTWNGRRWVNRAMKGAKPLYNLPDLLARPDAPVLFVEGEKTADAAARLFPGFVVTTTAGGCNAFADTDYAPLKTRDVVLWRDNDEAGRVYAANVSKRLCGLPCASQGMVEVPATLPHKWDLADYAPDSVIGIEFLHGLILDAKKIETANGATKPNGHDKTGRVEKIKFETIRLGDVMKMLNAAWLIKGLMPARGLMIIYGEPEAGKSFIALDAGVHVAAGLEYAGRKVFQAGVAYLAAEGQAGFQNRVWALREHLKLAPDTPFWLILTPPDLGKATGDAKTLIADIRAQVPNVGALFVDTLNRTMNGTPENSDEGMGAFIANAAILASELNCLVVVVHHCGKDAEKGMRGHSSLHGAADCEWFVANEDGARTVTVKKQKDGPGGFFWSFGLREAPIGTDDDGDEVTTCLIDIKTKPRIAGQTPPQKRRASKAEIVFENAFNEVVITKAHPHRVFGDGPLVRAVDVQHLREAFFARWATGEEDLAKRHEAARKAFGRLLEQTVLSYGRETIGKTEWIWRLKDDEGTSTPDRTNSGHI